MKKKFVLITALVLLVAVGLSAATPLELSGNFKAGYEVALKSGANGIAGVNNGSEISLGGFSVSGDFWKVAFAKTAVVLGDNNMKATATIYLSKALAAQGMDMGDLSLEMAIGNKGDLGGLSVYANSRDDLSGLTMKSGFSGAYASSMTVGYGDLVTVMVGADPVSFIDKEIAAVPAYGQFNPASGAAEVKPLTPAKTVAANNAFVISAKTTPVEGVSAAIAYTNVSETGSFTSGPLKGTVKYNNSDKGAIAGSVKVDVAALASIEDFGLVVSAYDLYRLEDKKNLLYLELNGSFGDFSAWTEYRILDKQNDMKLNVSYAGIENVGLSAFVQLDNLTDATLPNPVGKEVKIGGGANYMMGGVTYAFDANYAIEGKTFTMSPSVKIVF